MPRKKASTRERKPGGRRASVASATKIRKARKTNSDRDDDTLDSPPPPINPEDITVAGIIGEFELARKKAMRKGSLAAAVTATTAKARLAGLFEDKSKREPAPAVKFDGNYAEAARRVALLLRLGTAHKENVSDPKKVIEHKPKDDGDDGPSPRNPLSR